jgi:hypothetical protein
MRWCTNQLRLRIQWYTIALSDMNKPQRQAQDICSRAKSSAVITTYLVVIRKFMWSLFSWGQRDGFEQAAFTGMPENTVTLLRIG